MNDLLPRSLLKGTNYVDLKKVAMKDLEMGDFECADGDRTLPTFFEDVSVIKKDTDATRQLLLKLQLASEKGKTIHKVSAMKALRDQVELDMVEILKKAKLIKANLEDLDKSNLAIRAIPGCELGTPADRTRTSITNSLRKKLKDLMEGFQELRHQIMEDYKETVERRYYTVTGQHPDEETVEQIIKTGESENFLQKAIQEQGRTQVLDTIVELQERHDAAKEIEHNLHDLHQIFLDMSIMVEAQGEQLNDIEHQLNQACAFVDGGSDHLKHAKLHQKGSHKYMGFALTILFLLILIVIIPVVSKFLK